MDTCPHHKLRKDLPPLIPRIAKLPVDDRGYPVPFFVAWVKGKPEFQMADGEKRDRCFRDALCWVCGEKLGSFKAFVLGPMCCINRTTSEPPTHFDCAQWSVKGCPFLIKPQMVRRENEVVDKLGAQAPGLAIMRNPGVTAIWVTRSYKLFWAGNGQLVNVGEPIRVMWYKEGRAATRDEVLDAIAAGKPTLDKAAETQRGARERLDAMTASMIKTLLPP